MAWEMIPPTSRNILDYMTTTYSRRFGTARFQPDELIGYIDERTKRHRWAFVDQNGEPSATGHTAADKGIGPLLRLGLLAPKDGNDEHLILTKKGDATCRVYWNRSDRNDSTLPVIGMGR